MRPAGAVMRQRIYAVDRVTEFAGTHKIVERFLAGTETVQHNAGKYLKAAMTTRQVA